MPVNNELNLIPTDHQKDQFNKFDELINNNKSNVENFDNESTFNCQYYDIDEFCNANFNSDKSLSILNLNIHSLQLHIEELKMLLNMLDFNFDLITISESKLRTSTQPTVNIEIDGYEIVHTPTEASKGGALLYISKKLNYKPRNDLKIYKSKELESVFIEIININIKYNNKIYI